jgi:glycosyltransferase involved in cell wall biosynthesis
MTAKKRILLAINHPPQDVILETLKQKFNCEIDYIYITSTGVKGIMLVKRHFTYLQLAIKTMFRRNKYDYVIFWQQFIGIYYAFLSKFFIRKTKPKHILLTFIYLERKGFVGSLHTFLYRNTVNSKLVKQIVCHSSLEKDYYIKMFGNEEKFNFIPIGTREPLKNTDDVQFQDFFFAAGRSNRDYRTLIEAFRELDEKLIIACVPQNVEGVKIPDNVEVLFNAYNDVYLNYLKNAKAIIIPIKDVNVSAGQLVLVETMRYGKAAIVTEGPCMLDYDGAENILFVGERNKDDIVQAVKKLAGNDDLVRKMGQKAGQFFNENYTLQQYVSRFSSKMDM